MHACSQEAVDTAVFSCVCMHVKILVDALAKFRPFFFRRILVFSRKSLLFWSRLCHFLGSRVFVITGGKVFFRELVLHDCEVCVDAHSCLLYFINLRGHGMRWRLARFWKFPWSCAWSWLAAWRRRLRRRRHRALPSGRHRRISMCWLAPWRRRRRRRRRRALPGGWPFEFNGK